MANACLTQWYSILNSFPEPVPCLRNKSVLRYLHLPLSILFLRDRETREPISGRNRSYQWLLPVETEARQNTTLHHHLTARILQTHHSNQSRDSLPYLSDQSPCCLPYHPDQSKLGYYSHNALHLAHSNQSTS